MRSVQYAGASRSRQTSIVTRTEGGQILRQGRARSRCRLSPPGMRLSHDGFRLLGR